MSSVSPLAFGFSTFQTTRTIDPKIMSFESAFCVYFWRKCVFLYFLSLTTLLSLRVMETLQSQQYRADNNWTPAFPSLSCMRACWFLFLPLHRLGVWDFPFVYGLLYSGLKLDKAKTGLIFHLASCGPCSFLWSTHCLCSITHWPPPSLSRCAHPQPLT